MDTRELKENISNELEKYDWEESYELTHKFSIYYEVKFAKSIIRFVVNEKYGMIEACFLNPQKPINKRGYEQRYYIEGVIEALGLDKEGIHSHPSSKISYEDYIKVFIKKINKDLLNIIKGDFSWAEKYEENNSG